MKNLIITLENISNIMNPRYDGTPEDFNTIIHNSKDIWELVNLSFNYGYIQGCKATLTENRKKNRKNK